MDAHKDKAIKTKYSAALMSDHKWKKFFQVMAKHGGDFSGLEYRFTDTEKLFYGHAPSYQQVWQTAIDDPIEGVGGPVEYKHIESLLIPYVYSYRAYENAPLSNRQLDIPTFLQELKKVGIFPITEVEKGILIRGYQK